MNKWIKYLYNNRYREVKVHGDSTYRIGESMSRIHVQKQADGKKKKSTRLFQTNGGSKELILEKNVEKMVLVSASKDLSQTPGDCLFLGGKEAYI